MNSTTDTGKRSPREIERGLDEERRRLRETGRALQDKFSVGTLVDEVLDRTRERGPGYAVNLGRTIRDNPIPVALIGISLAWLLAGGQRASEERFRHDRGYDRFPDLDDDDRFPPPASAGTEPLREPPPAVGPADPFRPTPSAASSGPLGSGIAADKPGDEDDEKPLALGEGSRSGELRSSTPPPASRPLGTDEQKRPWQDDKDKEDKS